MFEDKDEKYEYGVEELELDTGIRSLQTSWGTYDKALATLKRRRGYEEVHVRNTGGPMEYKYIMVRRLKVGKVEDVNV